MAVLPFAAGVGLHQPEGAPISLLRTLIDPARGAVYRTSFVVQPDGSVTGAASESGDGCVQSALQQWALTFVYRPAGEPMATVVDWMCVTASRGR